jgi:hypothetical protein
MPIGIARLSLLPFPQMWDGASLALRFLCLPKGPPDAPLNPGLPKFSEANLVFEAHLIGSLARLPLSGDATPSGPLDTDPTPDKAALFAELKTNFNVSDPVAPRLAKPVFLKSFTESYRAVIGDRQRSQFLLTTDEFDCAVHQGATDQPEDPVVLPDSFTWGKVIALSLRQPNLARALGLLVEVDITPPSPEFFAAGGWVYIDLHATSDYAAAAGIAARYAARIPALAAGSPRSIFAPLLFPVTDAPSNLVLDDIYAEAELYQDGLAKLVHSAQTSDHGDGIRLAWEDEQIADWLNRQLDRDPVTRELKTDTPLGVAGYRVDVRKAGDDAWNSLVAVESGDLQLGVISLGAFTGEAVIEVSPTQLSPKQPGAFWFPSYFTTWRGSSLALSDADLSRIHARADVQSEGSPQLLQREKNFTPVNDKAVPLLYGNTYEFRVRMADLTRGGPDSSVASPDPPRHSISSVTFQRGKAPGPVEVVKRPPDVDRQIQIARPRLGYPEILFTGAPFSALEDDLNVLSADRSITREISLRDPDVATVQIDVQVRTLDGDVATWLPLYRTSRVWAGDEMIVEFDVQDHPTLLTLDVNQPDEEKLVLPAARDVRLTLTGIGHDRPGYFVSPDARIGSPVNIDLRAVASVESQLLAKPEVFPSLRSFFFQPPPADGSVASPIERLAAELNLNRTGLTLSARPDSRTVIACSAHLRHTLSPEASAITFSSAADLIQRWVNVVQFTLERDWTWDGLDPAGISVTRVVHQRGVDTQEVVGAITLPRALAQQVKAALPSDPGKRENPRAPVRQSTEVLFFDALDPKPVNGKFPAEITVDYILQPAFKGVAPPDPVSPSILLPVTTPPTQVPRIVSAGIALSEYIKADDYSSTEPRQRMLWLEFAEKPADCEDSYYVRVRALGPDPMLLTTDVVPPDPQETSIPLDPEWMRAIVPGQARDENGLNAMQPLAASATQPHYLVPLPANLKDSSPELFGFFVYEVRIGHTESHWCTAQGRFGPLLRVAGVQHPPPPLVCQGVRTPDGILIRAPYATPVLDGANVRPPSPATDLWALLYARVPQMDRKGWRNLLISRTVLGVPQIGNDPQDTGSRILYGEGVIFTQTLDTALRSFGLPLDTPLTVLAAELFKDPFDSDPIGEHLGYSRTLRISPLAAVRDAC